MLRNYRLNLAVYLLVLLMLIPGLSLVTASPVQSADVVPIRISQFQINTIDGKAAADQVLMAGASYKIQFTLEVAAGIKEKGVVKTALSQFGDHFWSFNGQYPGIDPKTWQPGQPSISFDSIEGTVQLELQGTVPENYVLTKTPTGESLHISKPITLIELSLASGRVLEGRNQEVIDKAIESYRSALQSKEGLLTQSKADSRYVEMVQLVINTSKTEAGFGYVEQATQSLQAIPQSGWITPQPKNYYQWIIIGVLVVVAVLLVLVFMSARSNLAFARKRADEQAKRLEILASRVKGIGDAKLAGEIDKVRTDLQQISGR